MDEKDYQRIAEALLEDMRSREGEWRWLREHICPSMQAAADLSDEGTRPVRENQICYAAWEALVNFAGAHSMYIIPSGQRWFSFCSAIMEKRLKPAGYDEWFLRATDVTHANLARSNFYTTMQTVFLERVMLGSGCCYIDLAEDGTLQFVWVPVGTFGIGEDEYRRVDKLARVFKLTPDAAAKKFGEKNLPEGIREKFGDAGKRYKEKDEYLHLVVPNPAAEFGTSTPRSFTDPETRKFLSVYMAWTGDRRVLDVSGYDEFPYFVTRFMPDGTSPWGVAPGSAVKREMLRLEKMERVMDVLGEVAAYPRVQVLEKQVGQVDFRAGGRTVVRRADAALGFPKEWGSSGRYDIGKDRIEEKERKVRGAFFEPMLSVFSGIDREMTATEVLARQEEKVIAFTPSFTLLISDLNALLKRVFSLEFEAGMLTEGEGEEIPGELVQLASGSGGGMELRLPKVNYNSKIAQTIERAQSSGATQYIMEAIQIMQATNDSTMFDIIDMEAYSRQLFETMGVSANCMRSESALKALRAQREAQEAQAMAAEQEAAAAKATRDKAAAASALLKGGRA